MPNQWNSKKKKTQTVWAYHCPDNGVKYKIAIEGYPIELDGEVCYVCHDHIAPTYWMVIEGQTGLRITGVSPPTKKEAEASARERIERLITNHGKHISDVVEGVSTRTKDLPEYKETT